MSNLIKSSFYVPVNEKKTLKVSGISKDSAHQPKEEKTAVTFDTLPSEIQAEIVKHKEELMLRAEEAAKAVLEQAKEDAEKLKSEAMQEIETWWQEKRSEDEDAFQKAQDAGYQQGLSEGIQTAEKKVRDEYMQFLQEAEGVLKSAYEHKRKIIHEAEPFLLELSISIAEKILRRELQVDQQWMDRLIKSMLEKCREQGIVTLCVAPSQYQLIYEARDELRKSLDSQAELEVLPDPAIEDEGCIVKTSFGSMDARITTQLNEIKQALLELSAAAPQIEEQTGHGDAIESE